jgi:hypothetical protein
MEYMNPPVLNAVRTVSWLIGSGRSMNEALKLYVQNHEDPFASKVRDLHMTMTAGHVVEPHLNSPWQNAFWELATRGCLGQPVLEPLRALEDEIERAAQAELDDHISTLPFRVMLPMLIFMFPAYLLVLLGPLIRELSKSFGN